MNIGFIGLGNIGEPMAMNILAAGYRLFVYDINTSKIKTLKEKGAKETSSPASMAQECSCILLSLPTSKEVKEVIFSSNGLVSGISSGSLVIDLTSGVPSQSRSIANSLRSEGVGFVDAGVSGGRAAAEAASLGIMIGGIDEDVDRAWPVLESIGENLYHMGAVGAGHLTKSLNNFAMAANMTALSEALAVATKAGLAPEKVIAAINASSGRSWVSEYRFPEFVLKGDFGERGGMALELLIKDIGIACTAGKEQEVSMFLGNLLWPLLNRMAGDVGFSVPNQSVAKAVEEWAGVKIRVGNSTK